MKAENAIEVRNLKITYKCIKTTSIKKSLFRMRKSKVEVHEALKGISFDVKRGEILGIVGKNGSGKSTLLRAIGGIFSPDEGTIDLNSESVSLLSIGVGFQKKLSGRENIMLSGLLLGFTEEQIRAKMDEIIAFIDDLVKEGYALSTIKIVSAVLNGCMQQALRNVLMLTILCV